MFPGGALIGCAAGFVNVPKIKGSHTAMKSGMLAAEAVFEALAAGEPAGAEVTAYPAAFEAVWAACRAARACATSGRASAGASGPGCSTAASTPYSCAASAPWTLHHHADHTQLKPKTASPPIDYPKPDGKLTFDRLSVGVTLEHQPRGEPAVPSDA